MVLLWSGVRSFHYIIYGLIAVIIPLDLKPLFFIFSRFNEINAVTYLLGNEFADLDFTQLLWHLISPARNNTLIRPV